MNASHTNMRDILSNWRTIGVSLFFGCFVLGTIAAQTNAQNKLKKEAEQFVASGNSFLIEENNFGAAEGEYRQAIAKNPEEFRAKYNLGTAYYATQNYEEAIHRYTQTAKSTANRGLKHMAYHNLGNTHMRQQKFDKAVDAYKDALRNNPTDEETRYNLALAKKMKEEQDKQGGNDKNKENGDNKDQKDQKDQEDKKEGDQKDGDKEQKGEDKKDDKGSNEKEGKDGKEKDDKEGEEKEDDKGDPKDEKGDKEKEENEQKDGKGPGEEPKDDKKQPPRPVKGQLSPEQVKSLLEAMSNQEKNVQKKINENKAKGAPVQTDKDW